MSMGDENKILTENNVSPLGTLPDNFRSALDEFRENWQRELIEQKENDPIVAESRDQVRDLPQRRAEQEAEFLYRKAVDLEQRGKVYDALPLYRKATQIQPDIEFKYYENQKRKNVLDFNSNKAKQAAVGGEEKPINDAKEYGYEEYIADLGAKFREDLAYNEMYGGKMILSNRDANVLSTEIHISDLPPEILIYILRWVVSSQLDMKSLEQCAGTCKGFYLCARDDEIWRLACAKVWGHNVGTLSEQNFDDNNDTNIHTQQPLDGEIQKHQESASRYFSWRQMYLERERIHFSGCYISKTTYLRMGENSFQDQFYRPVQLVEYYRYIRFLPDGKVLMMTTADEPPNGVSKLKNLQNIRPDVLRGYYRLFGATVTLMLHKQQMQRGTTTQYARHRRGSSALLAEEANSTKYVIEFQIISTQKRKFIQLVWQHYSIQLIRNKIETSTQFDLVPSKYPPLWFSPVRSYHLDADAPLA